MLSLAIPIVAICVVSLIDDALPVDTRFAIIGVAAFAAVLVPLATWLWRNR
jgi:hypothetical protein